VEQINPRTKRTGRRRATETARPRHNKTGLSESTGRDARAYLGRTVRGAIGGARAAWLFAGRGGRGEEKNLGGVIAFCLSIAAWRRGCGVEREREGEG
jgi:hypothetical protein